MIVVSLEGPQKEPVVVVLSDRELESTDLIGQPTIT